MNSFSYELLRVVFGCDRHFHGGRGPLDPGTVDALRSFAARDELGEVVRQFGELTSWEDMQDWARDLLAGRRTGGWAEWESLPGEAERLPDAVAASIVGLLALFAWEGGTEYLIQSRGVVDPGWGFVALPLTRSLIAAEAIFGPWTLCDAATQVISSVDEVRLPSGPRRAGVEFRRLRLGVERRYYAAVADLAWDLRESAGPGSDSFAADLAAMLWTVGRPAQAEALAFAGGVPEQTAVERLVNYSVRTVASEPLLQYLWLGLKDRGPFDLRSHVLLFRTLDMMYHPKQYPGPAGFLPETMGPVYARVAVRWFAGEATAGDGDELAGLMGTFGNELLRLDPTAYLRLGALTALVKGPMAPDGSVLWRHLADIAAQFVEQSRWRGDPISYNCFADAPLYYLPVDGPELDSALAAIERHRVAGIAYWLASSPPLDELAAPAAAAIRRREDKLIDRLRGARFVRLVPRLPLHYRRSWSTRAADNIGVPDPDGPWWDQDRALGEIRDVRKALDDIYTDFEAVLPAGAWAHRCRQATPEDLMAAMFASTDDAK